MVQKSRGEPSSWHMRVVSQSRTLQAVVGTRLRTPTGLCGSRVWEVCPSQIPDRLRTAKISKISIHQLFLLQRPGPKQDYPGTLRIAAPALLPSAFLDSTCYARICQERARPHKYRRIIMEHLGKSWTRSAGRTCDHRPGRAGRMR